MEYMAGKADQQIEGGISENQRHGERNNGHS